MKEGSKLSYKICIDNGHGYNTPGKRTPVMPDGRVIREWEFNHPTAKKLEEVLNRCGFSVVMVSDTEEDTPLETRVERANKERADAFISIHYNALKGIWGEHGGIETYYYKTSAKGKRLAELVQKELIRETGRRDRGIKEGDFYVLRATVMPAILCECGFMDNLEEANLMLNESYQWKIAEAIGKGVCNYFGAEYISRQDVGKNILYKVQIGAFKDRKNAEELAQRAKQAGFDAYIVEEIRYNSQL